MGWRSYTVLAWLLPCCGMAGRPLTVPYRWTEDFQANSLGQFASYPPVQDVGYDPSLSPVAGMGAPGGRALMRVVKPPRTGPEGFGFIRRLHFLVADGAQLQFSYRLDYARPEDRLEIGLAGADARRYTAGAAIETGGAWHTVRLPLAGFQDRQGRAPAAGTGIDGIYVIANLQRGDSDITYRFLIDDLELRAAREAGFEMLAPKAARIAHWRSLFSTAMLSAGQPLPVEARAPVPLARAECEVRDQDGKTVRVEALHGSGRNWSNATVAVGDAPGVYQLVLRGTTQTGDTVTTAVRVVCRKPDGGGHPRLYFGPGERAVLLRRIGEARYAGLWRELAERARASRDTGDLSRASALFAMLDPVNLLPTLPGYFSVITKAGLSIQYNALHGWVTGDAASRAAAKAALLAVARWSDWAPPWFAAHGQRTYYPAGELAAQSALGYDLLYGDLSPGERETVQHGLLERAIQPSYEEYVEDNRILANTSNWISHTVGGGLLAAAALSGDAAPPGLDLYINGLLAKLEDHLAASYLADGSYGEGHSYQDFDLETDALALPALERVFGLDYWKRSHVKDSLWYAIATLAQPVAGSLDMGDSHPPTGRNAAPVVARSGNPVFRWFADHFALSALQDLLFPYDHVRAEPQYTPASRYFPDKGMVVFRSGAGEDENILLYRAGPNFNHNHADQGSFLLRALGENLVTEAGYSDYYKDLYYDSYFKQAAGHNTVLVDGDAASQEVADTLAFPALHRYPRITDVLLSAPVDAVASELQQVYRGRLKSFERRLVLVKPDYLIVSDELATDGGPAQFDWRLHLPDRRKLETTADGALYRGAQAALDIRVLSPRAARSRAEDGRLSFAVFNPVAPETVPAMPAVLDVAASGAALHYVVALAPGRTAAAAEARGASFRWTAAEGGAAIESHGDVLLLRNTGASQVSYGGWKTDAAMLFVRAQRVLAVQSATVVQRGGQRWLTSTRPVSLSAEFAPSGARVSASALAPATVKLRKPDGGTAELEIRAGRQELTLPQEVR